MAIEEVVTRADFERWIAGDLGRMGAAVDDAKVAAGAVDHVFLTGGTSFVPAVRGLFEARFGAERGQGTPWCLPVLCRRLDASGIGHQLSFV